MLRLDGFIEIGRHSTDAAYLGPQFPLEATSDVDNPQTSWNAHAMWTASDATVVDLRTGGYDKTYFEDTHPPGRRERAGAALRRRARRLVTERQLRVLERQPCA